MFGGHSEMDGPYYVMIPLHLLCVWYDIQSFGYVSMHALDKNEMNASSCDIWASIHVLFLIYFQNVISLCYTLKTTICYWYAPYANDILQLPFLDCMNKTCFERYDIVILHSNKTCYCFILYLCFVFWYLICLKTVLFAMDMLVICWALYAHPVAI